MKLLHLKIECKEGFRSLQESFEIKFHTLENTEAMESFRPFCFAGLNGSGKSNVLEALANIFYHLELCVARYLPDSITDPDNFKRTESTPDAFSLEYLIGPADGRDQAISNFNKIMITKKVGSEPALKVFTYPFTGDNIIIPNPDTLKADTEKGIVTELGKIFEPHDKGWLPESVIGYSSGENEILSLPFIKSRLIRLDEYKQATEAKAVNYDIDISEKRARNSLVYIDNGMSQAVLLACLLFEDETTLAPLREVDNTGIMGLRSFRMNIQLQDFEFQNSESEKYSIPVLKLIDEHQISALMKCATSWYIDRTKRLLWLDFYVNEATKDAFKKYFNDDAFECFQCFRLLYELNSHFVNDKTKEDVYRSKGVYTDGKLPVGSPQQDVFHFLDFYITKKLKKTGEEKDLLLRSFSDGEHQFIHTMGICLLLKKRRSILLLDEPETHFNPSWRAKFVKILNDSISAGNRKDSVNGNLNVHLLKDVLLTSHSPFIISDCLPDNVILFEKDDDGNTTAKRVSELENAFNTYGTSVELILDRLFGYNQSIGDLSYSAIEAIDLNSIDTDEDIEEAKAELRKLGESIEKDLVLAQLNRKLKTDSDAKTL